MQRPAVARCELGILHQDDMTRCFWTTASKEGKRIVFLGLDFYYAAVRYSSIVLNLAISHVHRRSKQMTTSFILFFALSVALLQCLDTSVPSFPLCLKSELLNPRIVFSQEKKNPSCLSFAKQARTIDSYDYHIQSHASRIAIRNSRAAIMEARSIPSARTGRRTWGGWRLHPAPSSHGMLHLLLGLPPYSRCSRAGRLQALLLPSLPAAAAAAAASLPALQGRGRRRWEAAAWSKHYLWGPVPAFQARWRAACILKKIILIGFVDWPWRLVYLYERVRKFCETLCTQTSNELFF